MTSPTPLPSLTLIIRFSTSIPDLPLIITPTTTTPTKLRTLTRPHLPPHLSTCPLRFIHLGGILDAHTPLSTSLRLSKTGKSPQELYIHCSISTTTYLSPAELAQEARAAAQSLTLQESSPSASSTSTPYIPGEGPPNAPSQPPPPGQGLLVPHQPQPQPLGFDRLLTAGLTQPEIAALRSQFLAIQSHTHTPDTMPSPTTLRLMEERWLDSSASDPSNTGSSSLTGGGSGVGGGGGGVDGMGDEEGGVGALEDILWGNVMGFFWAVGAGVWLCREEGVWSRRRRVGVLTGVLVNVAFCVMRVGGAGG